jgi:hypothetical protein
VLSSYSTRAAPSLRDRSSLFGSTPVASGLSRQQSNGHRYADDLEGQNDEAIEGLSAKVKLLKDVSLILFSWFQISQSILYFGWLWLDRLPLALGTKCESPQYSSVRWYVIVQLFKSQAKI